MPQSVSSPTLKVLIFSASLRADSLNSRLAALAAGVAGAHGATVDLASMHDFDVPVYDGDLEARDGIPTGARELQRRLEATDAFMISSPEYNASMPGGLKNLIDWTSRFRPQPFDGRHGLVMSASPSLAGGNRGLWALRVPLEHLGARVFPDMFSLSMAHKAMTDEGLSESRAQRALRQNHSGVLVPGRSGAALSVHQASVGRVPRRASRRASRSRRCGGDERKRPILKPSNVVAREMRLSRRGL